MTQSEHYIDMLFSKYHKTSLTRKELANELNISLTSLENLIYMNGLPIRYKRVGNSQKAKYLFPLIEVANYLSSDFQNAA